MLRKPAIYSSIGAFFRRCCLSQSYSNNTSDPYLEELRLSSQRNRRWAYSQSGCHLSEDDEDFPWPRQSSAVTLPTPYEILHLEQGNPYSKKRFYELVKIYHPDRSIHGKSSPKIYGPSQAIKLERYRLIVAANDILSDPLKRIAYDRYGAGWDGFKELDITTSGKSRNSRWTGFEDNESIFRNATWEDWEKWYQRNNRPRPEPVSLENRSFFTLIAFVAALAAVSQFSKAGQASQTFLDQVGIKHDTSSKNLHESRFGHGGSFPNKDQRIRKFLYCRKQYDPSGTSANEDAASSPTLRTEV